VEGGSKGRAGQGKRVVTRRGASQRRQKGRDPRGVRRPTGCCRVDVGCEGAKYRAGGSGGSAGLESAQQQGAAGLPEKRAETVSVRCNGVVPSQYEPQSRSKRRDARRGKHAEVGARRVIGGQKGGRRCAARPP
jgi:hypothetical protein